MVTYSGTDPAGRRRRVVALILSGIFPMPVPFDGGVVMPTFRRIKSQATVETEAMLLPEDKVDGALEASFVTS